MRLTSKSVIVTGAGVVLLGTSLALSSAGVVSGASALAIQPDASCTSSAYCLTESNFGKGGAIKGTSATKAKSGTAAILARHSGLTALASRAKAPVQGARASRVSQPPFPTAWGFMAKAQARAS